MNTIPTIIIPENNDFIYGLTIKGVNLANVDNLHAFASTNASRSNELACLIQGGKIKIPFRNLKQGAYNLWVTFKSAGQIVSVNIKEAFKIVPWNNHYVNWEDYKEGTEVAGATGVCIITQFGTGDWDALWNDIESLQDAKEEAEQAAEKANQAADYAIQEGEKASGIYTQVKQAYDSGEFKGDPGQPGAPGAPGEKGADGGILFPDISYNPANGILSVDGEGADRFAYNEASGVLSIIISH